MSPPLDPELARVGSGHSRSAETSAAAPVPSGWRVQSRLNLREDAHTSSSPATQDAWGGGRTGLLPGPLPKVPPGRAREVVAEETRALAPAPGRPSRGQASGNLATSCQGQSSCPMLRRVASAGQRAQPGRVRRAQASSFRASRQVLEPFAGEERVPRRRPRPGSRRGRGSRRGGKNPT